MKNAALICLLFTSGCAGGAAYVPILAAVLEQVGKMVKDKTGKDISELPMDCTIDPVSDGDKEVNVLCTIHLEK